MFNNYINVYELIKFSRRISVYLPKVFSKLKKGRKNRVVDTWSKVSKIPSKNWWDIPAVKLRWNKLITGNPDVSHYDYISKKYFENCSKLKGLSLGCGLGQKELQWAKTGIFSTIEAYDLSLPRINEANRIAREQGLESVLNYQVKDIYDINASTPRFDIVIGEQSFHHFSPLKPLFETIQNLLLPGGYFIVNDFVGPTKMQWSRRQLEIVNGVLDILPHAYKKQFDDGRIKKIHYSPSRLGMWINDPSEAVESGNIMPLLKEMFEVVEIKEYGGTILHLLFEEIAHNFLKNDPATNRLLQLCFEIEDVLLELNDIPSDFVLAICRKVQ